jgi:hypothetical protein
MKIKAIFLSLFTLLMFAPKMHAQYNDLNIFGFFQNNYANFNVYLGDSKTLEVNSFLMQQLNVFFQKNYGPQFSSFVNFEYTNSFSSEDSIGGFKIQEAWFKYSPSSQFNVKAGVLIPRFNNFNEIKNRTVLMPYIYRPIAYETYFFGQFGTSEFVPTTANIQVYGDLPVGDAYLNYTVFYGNSETTFLRKNADGWGPGQDDSPYKMVGGRVGIEYDNLQFGVSTTYDRTDYSNYDIGSNPRTRLGAYLNYSLAGFELEAEMIKVTYELSQTNKATLEANPSPFAPKDFDKDFYHVNLLYNITDELSAYVGYDRLSGGENIYIQGGLNFYNIGASYYVTNSIILKAQYEYQVYPAFQGAQATRNDYLLGASISF